MMSSIEIKDFLAPYFILKLVYSIILYVNFLNLNIHLFHYTILFITFLLKLLNFQIIMLNRDFVLP